MNEEVGVLFVICTCKCVIWLKSVWCVCVDKVVLGICLLICMWYLVCVFFRKITKIADRDFANFRKNIYYIYKTTNKYPTTTYLHTHHTDCHHITHLHLHITNKTTTSSFIIMCSNQLTKTSKLFTNHTAPAKNQITRSTMATLNFDTKPLAHWLITGKLT